MSNTSEFMLEAIRLAEANVREGGGPFGCVVVRNGEIVGAGVNRVTTTNDPTAHAEVEAIRAACARLKTFQLDDCTLYCSCEPCPMCLGAIYWARPERVVYAATREEAARAGFDDMVIYDELCRPPGERRIPMERSEVDAGRRPFEAWNQYAGKTPY